MGQSLCKFVTRKLHIQSFGAPSSVLSSLSTFRARPFADITYNPTPDVNEVYPGLYVGDA